MTRRAPRATTLVLAVALAMAGATATACGTPRPKGDAEPSARTGAARSGTRATVDHVTDGDTVELAIEGRDPEPVRLLGIDTPETVKPGAPVECFGPEASARTKALLPEGTEVVVQRDVEARDRYGRLLLYVWRRADGLFVNGSLVASGHARTLSIAPNDAHRAELSALAAAAEASRRGLWGACAGEPP